MDSIDNYNALRSKLVFLYKTLTEYTYLISLRRSAFFTIEQIEQMERVHPAGGIDRYNRVQEMPITVEKMLLAYRNVGEELHLGFRYPRQDIPKVYENIQQYIKGWMEMKLSIMGFETVKMEELIELENLARMLFSAYKYYKIETKVVDMNTAASNLSDGLASVYLSLLKYGQDNSEDISFISYIDLYHEATGETGPTPEFQIPSQQNNFYTSAAENKLFELPDIHVGLS